MSQTPVHPRSSAPRDTIGFARKAFHGARAVGSFLPSLTTKALQKYGISAASLIMDWPAIVGRELAQHAVPERIKWPRTAEPRDEEDAGPPPARRPGAVLVLRVDSAKALDVQYQGQQIIERINAYFGYAAVAQLRVIQAPMPAAPARRQPRARAEPLTREVAGIADAGLRDALARLGAGIRAGR
ncbi:MAG: DciA family protein [Hyphomonadaceae bacterium]|nr:DciA family protein [Hyphomonadaceae bacterium]